MISFICRVCGFDNSCLYDVRNAPWKNGSGSHEHCGCCGVQFGYQDMTIIGIRKYRLDWFENISKWNDPRVKPLSWNPVVQLKQIPEEFI